MAESCIGFPLDSLSPGNLGTPAFVGEAWS